MSNEDPQKITRPAPAREGRARDLELSEGRGLHVNPMMAADPAGGGRPHGGERPIAQPSSESPEPTQASDAPTPSSGGSDEGDSA